LLVALAGILLGDITGILYFDGIASIIIGFILGGTAVWLAYETKGLLIGEAANRAVVNGIREIAASTQYVEHVNEVLTMHMGPEFILVNISISFKDEVSTSDIESAIAAMTAEMKQKYENIKRVFVEAEKRKTQNV
ncbi:cation diffusion facilitator family transporter, partial [Kaarinaea lacus]